MKWAGLAAHPALLWEAVKTAWAFRSRRGPLPSRALLRWRKATAYGTGEAPMQVEDVIRFLEWRRSFRALTGRSR